MGRGLGVLSSGNCSLEREIDKRKKTDMQTEFQKQKNETQPSHVFATSLGLVRDCMKFFSLSILHRKAVQMFL